MQCRQAMIGPETASLAEKGHRHRQKQYKARAQAEGVHSAERANCTVRCMTTPAGMKPVAPKSHRVCQCGVTGRSFSKASDLHNKMHDSACWHECAGAKVTQSDVDVGAETVPSAQNIVRFGVQPGHTPSMHPCHRLQLSKQCKLCCSQNILVLFEKGKNSEPNQAVPMHLHVTWRKSLHALVSLHTLHTFLSHHCSFLETVFEPVGVSREGYACLTIQLQQVCLCLCLQHSSCHRILRDEGSCTQAQTASRRCTCLPQVECWHLQCMQPVVLH